MTHYEYRMHSSFPVSVDPLCHVVLWFDLTPRTSVHHHHRELLSLPLVFISMNSLTHPQEEGVKKTIFLLNYFIMYQHLVKKQWKENYFQCSGLQERRLWSWLRTDKHVFCQSPQFICAHSIHFFFFSFSTVSLSSSSSFLSFLLLLLLAIP